MTKRNTEGYRTKQKAAILSLLEAHPSTHYSAEDLWIALRERGVQVGKSTVYRALEQYVEKGLVRRFISDHNSSCYQYAEESPADASLHFHLRCTKCGKLYHVSCEHLTSLGMHLLSHHGFSVDYAKTTLYGVCASCSDEPQD